MIDVLARVVSAEEALEVGDNTLAAAILADLEEDLAVGDGRASGISCPDCSAVFLWPGEVADHRDSVHWEAV